MLISKILKSSKYLIIWKGFSYCQKGDESGYHRKDKPTRKVFAGEGSNAGHSKYCLETGELVALLAPKTLLEALF